MEISKQERTDLIKWLDLIKSAGWWGGYPFGESYIDTRSNPDLSVKRFVKFDNELSHKYPQFRGFREDGIRKLLEEVDLNADRKNT